MLDIRCGTGKTLKYNTQPILCRILQKSVRDTEYDLLFILLY